MDKVRFGDNEIPVKNWIVASRVIMDELTTRGRFNWLLFADMDAAKFHTLVCTERNRLEAFGKTVRLSEIVESSLRSVYPKANANISVGYLYGCALADLLNW